MPAATVSAAMPKIASEEVELVALVTLFDATFTRFHLFIVAAVSTGYGTGFAGNPAKFLTTLNI